MSSPTAIRPLDPTEARVLGTLMEKARTVPDTYPMTLNALLSGCNQKTSREPVMNLAESDVLAALEALRELGLVTETSGGRAARFGHQFQKAYGVPEQSAVLLGLLALRGPRPPVSCASTPNAGTVSPTFPRSRPFWTNCRNVRSRRAAPW